MLAILTANPLMFLILALIFVVSLTIHEFAHALVADKLGDPTPRYMGRLTLNPLAHLDPIGTLMILLVSFGWGKPVMINASNFKHPRKDNALVAFAGPLSNVLMAIAFSLVINFFGLGIAINSFLQIIVLFNLSLAFFNLIPLHPLDGFSVVNGILPFNLSLQWQDTARYGIFVLLIMMMTGSIGNFISPLVSISLHLMGL